MLHYETISPETLELLKSIQSIPALYDACLVGGTALALQLGHRKSIDLDMFGCIHSPVSEIRRELSDGHTLQILKESDNILLQPISWQCVKETIAATVRDFAG